MGDITLADGVTTITLPYELQWVDEFSGASGISAQKSYTLQGTMTVQEFDRSTSGRLVTLRDDNAWISRADLEDLLTFAATIDNPLTLTLQDGRTFTVRFRHDEGEVVNAAPTNVGSTNPASDYEYQQLEIKLMVV